MGYSVKWVKENLGITRKALRYFESKGLISREKSRNPNNNYRDYDEDDIRRIWNIKVLQGIGYSTAEIQLILQDQYYDFYDSISKKVEELEEKRAEITKSIEYAKTIRITGRIPTVKELGVVQFDEYLDKAREIWNLSSLSLTNQPTSLFNLLDWAIQAENTDPSQEEEMIPPNGPESVIAAGSWIKSCFAINTYYDVLSELYKQDYKNGAVQTIVGLLHKSIAELYEDEIDKEWLTTRRFSKYIASEFIPGSDMYVLHERNYGRERCHYIAEAIVYYGGYNSFNDFVLDDK